jgi:hypothetical protein
VSKILVGDYVRWDTDVDKVYSTYTKTFVGKVGRVLPPQEYFNSKGEPHLTPKGLRDVAFPHDLEENFIVGNIPESELVKVDAP